MKRRLSEQSDDGVSPVVATLLLIALTLILCAIIAACLMNYTSSGVSPSYPPEILAIESVNHYNGEIFAFASKVTLINIGTEKLWNSDYSAKVYINGEKKFIIIKTLRADEFIPTQHFGIQLLYGSGPRGYEWEPENSGVFDLNDGTIHPGDVLRIDIIRKEDGKVISRSIKLIE
ncbi:MAG: type IV pilin [Methanocorpusculum sp.]|uniref:type IV pilin n=1 Tax=Methanocorpusculum sp. TaxID=2058474 RepID=UPI00271A13A8|nr:type IV pilin [Methanocorpusculum sp.]MDO9523173.1 type IV pilin [Methanocorpusculum sp.]